MTVPDLLFQPPVLAHRGVRALAPENTMAAFRLAPQQGARWIETDVKLTHDGVPVLIHDDTLDRTTSGRGPVADMTWAEMQTLDAGGWFGPAFTGERVPLLTEMLHYALNNGLRLNLELKPCPGRTRATAMVSLIETAKIWPSHYPPPLISSYDIEALTIAAQLHPDWPRGLLLEAWRDDWPDLAQKTGAASIHIDGEELTREHIERLMQRKLPVLVYTVNDPARAREWLQWGVKAVFSDNPGEIIRAL